MTATLEAPSEQFTAARALPGPSPAVHEGGDWASEVWWARARRLARSAQRAVHVFPEVAEAHFEIGGTPGEAHLSVRCSLLRSQDLEAVIETVGVKVVEDLEQLLGEPFAHRRVSVRVLETATPVCLGITRAA